ncbi:hypothetical protein ACGFK1_16385 [Mycobacterium sp. NPDC048908]|uniref:hypothetical protein n=1 Tax=Mycobacterium sp. NPDC048908 TaxID=3364292 RepID=UPI0037156470
MTNNKAIAIVLGAATALFTISLIVRFVILSTYGVSGSWIYFSLPFGGIGLFVLLLKFGLLNFAERSRPTIQPPQYHTGTPASPVSAHLQQLDGMRSSGALSEADYNAKRQQIISAI